MSIDACKITNNSSIFLKKIRPSTNSRSNDVILLKDTDNNIQVKKSRSTSLNKLQSVGLSLVASVTKKRSSNNNNTATTTNRKSTQQVINKKHVSTNSLPTVYVAPVTSTLPPPQMRLRPSISARPFSQFFFPIKEEKAEDTTFEQPSIMYNKNRMGHLKNERGQLPPQQTQRNKQQQQQKHQKLRACKKLNTSKRHSIAVDFNSSHEDTNNIINSSNTSSRSSSLKTVKSHSVIDNVVIATNDTVEIQSEITFAAATTNTTAKKRNLSRSVSQLQQVQQQNSNSNNNRLSSVARARTVLRLDSVKSREMRAISVWKDTVSQLSLDDLHYDDSNNSSIEEEDQELQEDDELYEILTHPALIPEQTLERQRFVRRSSPKDMAMMKFILNELIATEKSYNQLLLLIQNRYMKPMVEASQSKDPLVKSSDIPLLFNHLPQLVQLSDRLLDQFTKTSNIGHVFKSIESDLVVFLKYAMHYRTNLKTIRKACSNVLFVKIDQETLAKRDSNRLGMSDYFIAPIQRIPRYCLLIKDLQKYTHPMDTNYLELDFALKTLTGLAVAMDHVQNKVPSNTRTSIRTL